MLLPTVLLWPGIWAFSFNRRQSDPRPQLLGRTTLPFPTNAAVIGEHLHPSTPGRPTQGRPNFGFGVLMFRVVGRFGGKTLGFNRAFDFFAFVTIVISKNAPFVAMPGAPNVPSLLRS